VAMVLAFTGDDNGASRAQSIYSKTFCACAFLRKASLLPSSFVQARINTDAYQVALAGPASLHIITRVASSFIGQLRMMTGSFSCCHGCVPVPVMSFMGMYSCGSTDVSIFQAVNGCR
jgi:hypothetical protein